MSIYYVGDIPFSSENALAHYGRKGMKWGKNIFGADYRIKYGDGRTKDIHVDRTGRIFGSHYRVTDSSWKK